MAKFIVNEGWQSENMEDSADDAECKVIAAAIIIRAEIRETI